MSRSLRISRTTRKNYDDDDIEDVDSLIRELEEKGGSSSSALEDIEEESLLIDGDDEAPLTVIKKTHKSIPIKIGAKGTRTIHIKELDPDIIPPTLGNFEDPEHTGSKLAVIGKPGCFARGTKVRMFDGTIKNVEDIQVGEQVMGDDSTPRNVLELCRGIDVMYEIHPYNGKKVVVNSKHILSLVSIGTEKHRKGEILDIPLNEYLVYPERQYYQWYRTPVAYPETPVDIDPYEFGRSLGMHSFIPSSKTIPLSYKTNSRDVRLKVLAGLLDEDGLLVNNGMYHEACSYELSCENETLLADVMELSRSLGFIAYSHRGYGKNSVYNNCRIIGETLREVPCKETRNVIPPGRVSNIKNPLISAFSVKKLDGRDEYFGFILDGNHRFLLDDFSVVHNTGKSSLIRSLLYEKSEIFPCCQVYSGTEDSNHSYAKFIPSTFIHNKFDEQCYKQFIIRQKTSRKYISNPWCVCVWDDITEDNKIFNTPIVSGTYKNGRHWKMLHLLSLQYALDIKPVIRTNIDGAFLLRETNKRNRKVLYENYASAIDDYSDFCSIFDQVTNDYTSLYIHNRSQSNKFEDCVFWYKARQDIPPNFKFGCREFWQFHDERYNPLYIDPITV